ncbi:MAG: hypothetical protein EU539_10020 [Promethearchaeota archaeon]|nr:MAG: hypothetical protein EU539_10020 [Candidatus Lokiarchaeota archaeon]
MVTEKLFVSEKVDSSRQDQVESGIIFVSRKASLKELFLKHSKFLRRLAISYHLLGSTMIFIVLESILFFLYMKTGFLFHETWILQILVISTWLFFVSTTFKSTKSSLLKFMKIATSLLFAIILTGLLILVSIKFPSLITLKALLSISLIYYIIKILLFIRTKPSIKARMKLKSLTMLFFIFFMFNGSLLLITLAPRTIEIKPKTKPELIFWAGSNQLPDDPEILEMCRKYDIGFMPTIREKDVGNVEYMESYKRIIAHDINLHFVMGGNSEFFMHIDNIKESNAIYHNISQWFESEGIMASPHVKSFSVDAEPPKKTSEHVHNDELMELLEYGYVNYPTWKEIHEATEALKELTDSIKNDGKECGMIQGSRFLDNFDQDGDASLFLRNVHSLPIKWDYTITMLYRTNRFQWDETDDKPSEFAMKALPIFHGAVIEGTKFTTSELSFFQNVALEEDSEDDLARQHYIFMGNFKREFKDTSYIKDEQYFMDFDICRHFKNERVYFYDLKGFLSHYGWEGIEELGKHAQQKDRSYLEYSTYKSLTFLGFYCGLIIFDLFVSLENNLS